MRVKITILGLLLTSMSAGLLAQPLVYNVENSGAACPPPALPAFGALPVIAPLPDPFMKSDNSSRSTNFADWECRRNEIKAEIENYEIGKKPDRPANITATYTPNSATSGTLRVFVTVNGKTLTLTSAVALPNGTGPFPAIIGMNSPSGSVPSDVFTTRNIARITYSHNNVTTYSNPQLTDPYYQLYPDQNLDNAGQYSAWAWGVSRIIDGLELVQASLPIRLDRIGVTGCSYAGKMALFAGAFDERIALTIAQESGGGGAPAWRVSETIGAVENLGSTDYRWFKNDMIQFAGANTAKLPHDHHELMAMVAPRALLVTGNTDFEWLANPSTYVSARATKEVYKAFGIGDRFGFYIDGGHGHCAVPASQKPAMEAFVQKFLVGDNSVNTDDISVNPYPEMDYQRWYKWWGTGNPVLPPPPPPPPAKRIWMEAECAVVGSNWDVLADPLASNGGYVTVKPGIESISSAPVGDLNYVVFSFNIDSAGSYRINARVNHPTASDDSYWIKVDNGAFVLINNTTTSGWAWIQLATANLALGAHTITMGYREDGAKLDKLLITAATTAYNGIGTQGSNCGVAPVVDPAQMFSISEAAANNSSVGVVLATDADADTEFQNWKIEGGTGIGIFSINASTGEIYLINNASLDFESSTLSYTLIVTTTDGYNKSAPETVTIHLTNVNDNAPVVSPGQNLSLDGGSCNTIGAVTATDADDTNDPGFTTLQNWQITGGTGASIFAIDPSTGVISIAHPSWLNFSNSAYTLLVTVSDGLFTSAAETVTISIAAKQYVCHKGNLIHIDKLSAMDHILHGDCIGSCAAPARALLVSKTVEESNGKIDMYPNPVKDILNIDLGENLHQIKSIEMLDLSGKKMNQVSVNGRRKLAISVAGFTPGVYMVRMNGTQVISQKIMVQ